MIVSALEIIYIYQSYGALIKFNIPKCILLLYSKQYSLDFNKMLIIQKTHAVLMLSIRHLIYVSIYVCCLKLIFFKLIFFNEFQNDLYIKS